jgi:type IV secretory pathway TraG/TraD family ATPase VirD4
MNTERGLQSASPHDFQLFIDEFHNFTTDSFAAILAEARKYRLCLTLSHQYPQWEARDRRGEANELLTR